MRVFLLDLWLDLREKRLAPVAILLLAGIIAVPIVLAKGEKAPPAPATPTTTTAAAAAPVIAAGQPDQGPVASKLQTFSPRDPFEPTGSSAAATTGGATTAAPTTGGSTPTGTSTGATTTGGGGGGGATTGTAPSTGTGTGTGTTGTGNTTGETKTTLFTYTVDLRFGEGGSVKAFHDVQRLDLVPSADNPKIVFLGVTTTGKTAVFLVDSNIGVDTPGGKCRPSPDECTFLYLRPDSDHDQAQLTDSDGTVYHLRLLRIHRVSVSSSNGSTGGGSGKSGSGNTNSNRSPAFTGKAERKSSSDAATVPGEDAPPGEPDKRSNFQQFFADSGQ